MKIKTIDGETSELKIVGFEFPDSNDEWDSEWLNIYLNIKSPVGNWRTVDPSLLVNEVYEIMEWFKMLADEGKTKKNFLEFLEPNLSFYLSDEVNGRQIKLVFRLESRPKSAKDGIEYFIVFKADEKELLRMVDELRDELSVVIKGNLNYRPK